MTALCCRVQGPPHSAFFLQNGKAVDGGLSKWYGEALDYDTSGDVLRCVVHCICGGAGKHSAARDSLIIHARYTDFNHRLCSPPTTTTTPPSTRLCRLTPATRTAHTHALCCRQRALWSGFMSMVCARSTAGTPQLLKNKSAFVAGELARRRRSSKRLATGT